MHSQEQLELLLESPIVQELLDILENEGKAVLQHLEFSYIDQLFEQRKKTKKGRPRTYPPSDNLRALLYGLAEGKYTLRGISRTIRTSVAQVFLGLDDGDELCDTQPILASVCYCCRIGVQRTRTDDRRSWNNKWNPRGG